MAYHLPNEHFKRHIFSPQLTCTWVVSPRSSSPHRCVEEWPGRAEVHTKGFHFDDQDIRIHKMAWLMEPMVKWHDLMSDKWIYDHTIWRTSCKDKWIWGCPTLRQNHTHHGQNKWHRLSGHASDTIGIEDNNPPIDGWVRVNGMNLLTITHMGCSKHREP